jgi:small subunit ribosomal protein S15
MTIDRNTNIDSHRPQVSAKRYVNRQENQMATTQEVMQQYQRAKGDTGSPEVQVALLTTRINELMSHFKIHVKDHHGRRGLLRMVSKRRSLLDYLKRTKLDTYRSLIDKLGLRK